MVEPTLLVWYGLECNWNTRMKLDLKLWERRKDDVLLLIGAKMSNWEIFLHKTLLCFYVFRMRGCLLASRKTTWLCEKMLQCYTYKRWEWSKNTRSDRSKWFHGAGDHSSIVVHMEYCCSWLVSLMLILIFLFFQVSVSQWESTSEWGRPMPRIRDKRQPNCGCSRVISEPGFRSTAFLP